MNERTLQQIMEDVMKVFNDPEIEAAILCGRSVDSAIQDYLEKHPLEGVTE